MKPTFLFAAALAAGCVLADRAIGEPLAVAKDDASIKISRGAKPVLEYRFASVPFKPYVSKMWTPGGVQVLRDSPDDHKHHHALMFAIEADKVDFWGEKPVNGKQLSTSLDDPATAVGGVQFAQRLDCVATNGTVILCEQRRIFLHETQENGATLLTWRSRLATGPNREVVTLTGHHYFGLGARFLEVMDKVGEFTNANGQPGETVRGDERLVAAKWCAYSAPADEKPVTIAMFDDPKNPRHPARMFSMGKPFAYLSATLNLWKEPMELKCGAELDLCYGVAVCDGKLGAADIEKLYQRWLGLRSASK
ncbi:MAG: PmoA family protein [Verrucomicrobia bacterium]|nr:PmoA family protein [Verrucomicrobiota bacterium]